MGSLLWSGADAFVSRDVALHATDLSFDPRSEPYLILLQQRVVDWDFYVPQYLLTRASSTREAIFSLTVLIT